VNDNGRNLMLDALAAEVSHVSLHDGWPGAGGINEISGGSPAYGRALVTWNPAASGALAASNQPSFSIPPAASISWAGFWNDLASTDAGDFYGAVPLGSGLPLLASGLAGDDTITAHAHPFANGDTVVFLDTLGSLPGGITEGTIYWVRDAATDTFKVSATDGGAAVDLLTNGVAKVYKIVEETYSGQGVHTFTSLVIEVE
jgi:hypothetical protein